MKNQEETELKTSAWSIIDKVKGRNDTRTAPTPEIFLQRQVNPHKDAGGQTHYCEDLTQTAIHIKV